MNAAGWDPGTLIPRQVTMANSKKTTQATKTIGAGSPSRILSQILIDMTTNAPNNNDTNHDRVSFRLDKDVF